MCFADIAEFSWRKWIEAKCIQSWTSLNTWMVKSCSAENNRFKRSWEFGGLRRRIVDGSFEQRPRLPAKPMDSNVACIGLVHINATWNRRNIIRIDILPNSCMIAARPPATHVEEREHRLSLVSLCTGDPTDDCRTRPVSKLWRDLLLRHHDPVRAGFRTPRVGGAVRLVILVQWAVRQTQHQDLIVFFLLRNRSAQEHDLSNIRLRIRPQHGECDSRLSDPSIPPRYRGTSPERNHHRCDQCKTHGPSRQPVISGHKLSLVSGEKRVGAFYVFGPSRSMASRFDQSYRVCSSAGLQVRIRRVFGHRIFYSRRYCR